MSESYLISVAMKSTVLLAAGLACLWLLRRGEPAVRHLIALLTLPSAALIPLIALWSPRWSVLISVPAGSGAEASLHQVGTAPSDWPVILAVVWLFGTFGMTIRAVAGWILLLRARGRSEHLPTDQAVEIRVGNVTTPLTCGVLRPMILLPASARDWDNARLSTVLLHESAHVRRRDCLAKYVAQASRAILWWNPLAWIVVGRLNQEQELACDEAVLASGVPAEDYASLLLHEARECSNSLILGCTIGGNAADLRERFAHLFEWRQGARPTTRRTAIAIPLLLVLMTTVSFAEKIYKMGPEIVAPIVLQKSEPQYTDEAREARIEGPVVLTIVVGTDQRAHDIQIVQSLDPGLDASAIRSIQTWRFQPGTKDGEPVAVQATVQVNFRLQ